MKLGLGTVQFGQAYGVSNPHGQVANAAVAAILAEAKSGGVTLLDTAANYGTAEDVLAGLDTSGFRIVTKTIALLHGLDAVVARARRSAAALKADTLLVHAVGDLTGPDGDAFWSALQGLKAEGVFARIGISAYIADDPVALASRFAPDVMQLPVSILDQRLVADGSLERLQALGVEIHARSLFLQGLLLMDRPPQKLADAAPLLARVRARLAAAGLTPLQAALGFARSRPEIAFGLVGVTSVVELADILAAFAMPLPDFDWASCALADTRLLTPSQW